MQTTSSLETHSLHPIGLVAWEGLDFVSTFNSIYWI